MSSKQVSITDDIEALIGFNGLPERDYDRLSCIHSSSPKKLSEWAKGLALINGLDVAPQMIGVLQELTVLDAQPAELYELWESVRSTTHGLLEILQSIYDRSGPLTALAKRAMQTAHQLDSAIILCLKSILAMPLAERRPAVRRRFHAQLGCETLIHFANIAMRLQKFCLELPKGFWREAHGIYGYLNSLQSHDEQICAPYLLWPDRKLTASQVHLSLVLYALIEPNRYHREIQAELLTEMFMLARLSSYQIEPGVSVYAVALTQDVSYIPVRAIKPGNFVFFLELENALQALKDIERGLFAKLSEPVKLLAPRFYTVLSTEAMRLELRQKTQVQVECQSGFSNIYKFLQEPHRPDSQSDDEIVYGVYDQVKKINKARYLLQDESTSGLRLASIDKSSEIPKSGDLFLVPIQSQFMLCSVRWRSLDSEGGCAFGLEKLASNPHAITMTINEQEAELAIAYGLKPLHFLCRASISKGQKVKLATKQGSFDAIVADSTWLYSGYVYGQLEYSE